MALAVGVVYYFRLENRFFPDGDEDEAARRDEDAGIDLRAEFRDVMQHQMNSFAGAAHYADAREYSIEWRNFGKVGSPSSIETCAVLIWGSVYRFATPHTGAPARAYTCAVSRCSHPTTHSRNTTCNHTDAHTRAQRTCNHTQPLPFRVAAAVFFSDRCLTTR